MQESKYPKTIRQGWGHWFRSRIHHALQVTSLHWSLSLPCRSAFSKALRAWVVGRCLSLIDSQLQRVLVEKIADSSPTKDTPPLWAEGLREPHFENQGHHQFLWEMSFLIDSFLMHVCFSNTVLPLEMSCLSLIWTGRFLRGITLEKASKYVLLWNEA